MDLLIPLIILIIFILLISFEFFLIDWNCGLNKYKDDLIEKLKKGKK